MKRLIIIPIIFIFIALGCKKIKEITTFTIKNSTEFIVPGTGLLTGIIQLPQTQKEVETSSSYEFKNNKTDAAHVQDVK